MATSTRELNELAHNFINASDESESSRLKDDLWTASLNYLQALVFLPKYRNYDVVEECVDSFSSNIYNWIGEYNPGKSSYANWLSVKARAAAQHWARNKKSAGRRQQEHLAEIHKYRQRYNLTEQEARAQVLIGLTPDMQQKVEAAMQETIPLSLEDAIPGYDESLTYNDIIEDAEALRAFEQIFDNIIDRSSERLLNNTCPPHLRTVIDQLTPAVGNDISDIDFGEKLPLLSKTVRIHLSFSYLRNIKAESLNCPDPEP